MAYMLAITGSRIMISGHFEWFSALITLGAYIALWRYKIGIIPLIGACALIVLIFKTLLGI